MAIELSTLQSERDTLQKDFDTLSAFKVSTSIAIIYPNQYYARV